MAFWPSVRVCLSLCKQNNSKSYELIFIIMKLALTQCVSPSEYLHRIKLWWRWWNAYLCLDLGHKPRAPDGRGVKIMASQGHNMCCSWTEGHGFESWLGRTWGAQYFCPSRTWTKNINCQCISLSESPCIWNCLTLLRMYDSVFPF